jgi:hypothetical protein
MPKLVVEVTWLYYALKVIEKSAKEEVAGTVIPDAVKLATEG